MSGRVPRARIVTNLVASNAMYVELQKEQQQDKPSEIDVNLIVVSFQRKLDSGVMLKVMM